MEDTAEATKLLNEKEKRVIDEFVRDVRETFKERVRRIVLFGSRARGDAEDDSDYDFLVLLEPFHKSDKQKLRALSFETSLEHDVLVTAFVTRLSDFTEENYFYLFENVCKEGIEL